MGAAAGAAVGPREGDDADLARQLLFAAVIQGVQGGFLRVGDLHGPVRPDGLVGFALRVQGLLPGDVRVIVDGHHIGSQVEAHIVTVVVGAENAGDDMLSGVLLHMVEAAGPVQRTGDGAADFHRLVAGVENDTALFMNIGDMGAAQGAVVRRLAAALGVEGGAVQRDGKAALGRLAAQDRGGEFLQKGVGVVELFGFHGENFLSLRDGDNEFPDRLR